MRKTFQYFYYNIVSIMEVFYFCEKINIFILGIAHNININ